MFYLIGSFDLTLQEERCVLNNREKLSNSEDNEILEFLSSEVFKKYVRQTSVTNDTGIDGPAWGRGINQMTS